MDPGLRSPLIECFLRGDVPHDVRLLAARGAVAPRAVEQLALLLLLLDDSDQEVALTATATLERLPADSVARFLGRSDATAAMRDFFASRGITPNREASGGEDDEVPLLDTGDGDASLDGVEIVADQAGADDESSKRRPLSSLSVMERIKLAMRGTREQRAVLVRDPNRLVAAAVLSSPKLSDTEIEVIARMTNVSDEVLRIVGTNRAWTKNYTVVSSLVRNPKTPPAISMTLVQRLQARDVKNLATDRNVPDGLRAIARKILAASESRRQ